MESQSCRVKYLSHQTCSSTDTLRSTMSLNLKKIRESGESQLETSNDGDHCLDHHLLIKLEDLVEKITTTGRRTLDEELMKQIKKICKIHDDYVEHTFHLVITQLNKGHSEIRLSAFQVINELFNRSHRFRELLVTDMQEFLEASVETDPDAPLPPPKAAATVLKESALKAIQQWQNKFGKAYKKLTLGYNFLKFQKKINFENIEARSAVERRRVVDRENRRQLAETQKVIKVLQKMQEKMPEIQESLTQMENCFELLLPRQTRPAERDSSQLEEDADSDEDGDMVDDCSSDQRNSPISQSTSGKSTDSAKGASSNSVAKSKQIDDRTSGTKGKTQDVVTETNEQSIPTVIKQEPTTPVDSNRDTGLTSGHDIAVNNDDDKTTDIVVKEEAAASSQVENQEAAMETEDVGTGVSELRQHGLPSRDYNLTIRLNTDGLQLTENEDNVDILHTLDDHYRLITSRYLPEIALWMMTLGKTAQQQDKLKRCIDVKLALKGAIEKYKELQVQRNPSSLQPFAEEPNVDSSDSEEEFEDVPEKDGYEPVIPEHLRKEYGLEPLGSTSTAKPTTSKPKPSTRTKPPVSRQQQKKKRQQANTSTHAGLIPSKGPKWHPLMETEHTMSDPASQAGTMAALLAEAKTVMNKGSSSPHQTAPSLDPEKQKLLSKAPVVPFGVDLEHWEQPENIKAPVILRPDSDHLVWVSSYANEEIVLESVKNSLSTRVMSYAGSFKPVEWKCRAPMPSGVLCERMDRVKCPFHGKIIGRDRAGQPTNPEDLAKIMKEQAKDQPGASTSSPFDHELQRDVEGALGLDLGSSVPNLGSSSPRGRGGKGKGRGGKKGKGKAKKYPNLTDIKKVKNTSRLRLEKKVLNKNAISRVANAMNSIDKKRQHDKFSNNFNYAFSN